MANRNVQGHFYSLRQLITMIRPEEEQNLRVCEELVECVVFNFLFIKCQKKERILLLSTAPGSSDVGNISTIPAQLVPLAHNTMFVPFSFSIFIYLLQRTL